MLKKEVIVVLIILTLISIWYFTKPKSVSVGEPILVYFHSETCPSCVSFNSDWDKFVNSTETKTQKIKASDAEDYDIEFIPDIRLYKGSVSPDKEFVKYDGDRTVEDMKKFISMHL